MHCVIHCLDRPGMVATRLAHYDAHRAYLAAASSVLCVCEQLSSDLPQGDTVAADVRFKGGGTAYVAASLANPFVSRFAVFGAKGWIDIRDKAHVEAPDGWVVTSAMAGGPIVRRCTASGSAARCRARSAWRCTASCAIRSAARSTCPMPTPTTPTQRRPSWPRRRHHSPAVGAAVRAAIRAAATLAACNPYRTPRPVERDAVRALLGRAWAGERPT